MEAKPLQVRSTGKRDAALSTPAEVVAPAQPLKGTSPFQVIFDQQKIII